MSLKMPLAAAEIETIGAAGGDVRWLPHNGEILQLEDKLYTADALRDVLEQAADMLTALSLRVAELEDDIERLKTVPMKYKRMEFNAQLQKENATLRAELDAMRGQVVDAFVHMAKLAEQEPVAGQSRFNGANWAPCSIAHVRMVIEAPNEWSGYQVRYLYAAPVANWPEPNAECEVITVQQAWEQAGGNPGIKATAQDLQLALKTLDEICDATDQPIQAVNAEFVRVIVFAIAQGISACEFLDAWLHGDTSEWPEFTPTALANAKAAQQKATS